MSRLPLLFIIISSLAAVFPAAAAAAFGEGPSSSISIVSETLVFNVNSSAHPGFQDRPFNFTSEAGENITSHGAFFFEARIRMMDDSAFMIQAVDVETNNATAGKGESVHNITDVSMYSLPDSSPVVYYHDPVDSQWSSSSNNNKQSRSIIDSDLLPIIIPRGGMLGITFEVFGISDGDQVKVTFMYLANAGSAAVTEVIPVADISLNPLDVSATFGKINATTTGDNNDNILTVNNAFSDPETHCELCTKMTYEPGEAGMAEASYTGGKAHISGASNVTFWARGEEGGETATFKAAGAQAPDGTAVYANSTQATLGKEWKMYAIGLPEGDLYSVSHPFSVDFFAANSTSSTAASQTATIYLKGITYN
jgi:hypothetical protein